MKISPLLLSLAMLAPARAAETTPLARHDKLRLRAATPNRASVPRFDKFELTLDLAAAYDNPFDPDDIAVEADFTAPGGKVLRVAGFLDQTFARKLENGTEKITAAGEPVWKIRFAPDAAGTWRYRVTAKDRTGTATLPDASFTATASDNLGFVRRSARNPLGFAFADEKPFFAVGENMGWAGKRGSYDFDDWLAALGKSGGNWMRIWMSNWNCGLEWSAPKGAGEWRTGDYHGVGVYNLANAWKLDQILDTAWANGVYTMVCFGTYGELKGAGGFFNEGQWSLNPYNAANGGPCEKPEDFWTNETARKLYRRRLRYLMARYAWRPGVHSWEFWNEANAPAPWIGEMARCLKGTGEFAGHAADPYTHLVTTTYGNDAIWKLPDIDFTQTHHYGMGNVPDHAPVIYKDARLHVAYNKPHLMGEFGIDWRDSDSKYDPEGRGINLHNGLWAGALGGDAGGGMLWWWDNYVHPKNLYGQFLPLRRFADGVAWTEGRWEPLTFDPPRATGGAETFSDLTIAPSRGWGKAEATEFTVTPTGVAGNVAVTQFLYSPGKADLRSTPAFRVNFAQPGRFIVRVDEVSASVRLRFLLDGQMVREAKLDATPPADPNVKPEYEKTELKPEWKIYQAIFNKQYAIDVPAGAHAITLDVAEGDWLSLSEITLTGYRSSRHPDVNVYGLTNGRAAILWLQNAAHNWKNVADKKPIPALQNLEIDAHGLPPGRYAVVWWDTWKGEATRRETVEAKAGKLTLHLPELATDVAARLAMVK